MAHNTNGKPVAEIRVGRITATIWQNTPTDDGVFYSVHITRLFRRGLLCTWKWQPEKDPPLLSCRGHRDVAGRSRATGGHVPMSAIAVAPPVACGMPGGVWRP